MGDLVTEAEGYKLHLSRRSSTGYLGVYMYRHDRYSSSGNWGSWFRGKCYAQLGYGPVVRRRQAIRYLGTHDTAVAAAVAVARHLEQNTRRVSAASPTPSTSSAASSGETAIVSTAWREGDRVRLTIH